MYAIFRYVVLIGSVITCLLIFVPKFNLDANEPKAILGSLHQQAQGSNNMAIGYKPHPVWDRTTGNIQYPVGENTAKTGHNKNMPKTFEIKKRADGGKNVFGTMGDVVANRGKYAAVSMNGKKIDIKAEDSVVTMNRNTRRIDDKVKTNYPKAYLDNTVQNANTLHHRDRSDVKSRNYNVKPNSKAQPRPVDPLKTILLWNPFFGEPDYGIGGFGTGVFSRTNCPHTCNVTNDRSQLATADAVVIHVYNMGPNFQNVAMPKRANEKQIFVFFILESPLKSYKGFIDTGFSFKDVFNLTFTFLDAPETDIYCPMGGIKGRKVPFPGAVPSIDKVRRKTQIVAWFVSNCKVPSARFSYANRLSRYIPVNIYGTCGNLSCPKGDVNCFTDVVQNTLFYLAFENTFCDGYATEKLIRTLRSPMVPIVYGGANYSKLAHPKSYIDVRDFASPSHLARYLLHLKRFPAKYMEYHRWKKYHYVLQEGDYKALGFCKLCSILNTEGYPYKSRFDPIKDYWNPDKWCVTGEEERNIVHLKGATKTHSWLWRWSKQLSSALGFSN